MAVRTIGHRIHCRVMAAKRAQECMQTQTKFCTGCNQLLPATTEFFHRKADGFHSRCKKCRSKAKPSDVPEGMRRCTKCRELKPATTEFFHRKNSAWLKSQCKECRSTAKPSDIPEGMKKCPRCNLVLSATTEHFHRRGNDFQAYCKNCRNLEQARKRYGDNLEGYRPREDVTEPNKKCTQCGTVYPRTDQYFPSSHPSNFSRDGLASICRQCTTKRTAEWRKRNPERRRENSRKSIREKRKNDPNFRVKDAIGKQIHDALRRKKGGVRSFKKLSYTPEALRHHLERQFSEGMNWDNYGKEGWHIDHIVPISSFKLVTENGKVDWDEVALCWALTNLRPLWAKDNLSKAFKRTHLI